MHPLIVLYYFVTKILHIVSFPECLIYDLLLLELLVQLLGLINNIPWRSQETSFFTSILIFLPKSINLTSKSVIRIHEYFLESHPKPWNQDFYIICLNICPHFLLLNHHDGFMVPYEVSIDLSLLNFLICIEILKKINLTYQVRGTNLI